MTPQDRHFYQERAEAERELARTARDDMLASIHSQLGQIYQGLADGVYRDRSDHNHSFATIGLDGSSAAPHASTKH